MNGISWELEQIKKLTLQNHILLVELGEKRVEEPMPEGAQFWASHIDTFTVWCQAEIERVRENIKKFDKLADYKEVSRLEAYSGGILYALQNYRLYITGNKMVKVGE